MSPRFTVTDFLFMLAVVVLSVAYVFLCGCAMTYSRDGDKSGFSASFQPSLRDYKAIKELTR